MFLGKENKCEAVGKSIRRRFKISTVDNPNHFWSSALVQESGNSVTVFHVIFSFIRTLLPCFWMTRKVAGYGKQYLRIIASCLWFLRPFLNILSNWEKRLKSGVTITISDKEVVLNTGHSGLSGFVAQWESTRGFEWAFSKLVFRNNWGQDKIVSGLYKLHMLCACLSVSCTGKKNHTRRKLRSGQTPPPCLLEPNPMLLSADSMGTCTVATCCTAHGSLHALLHGGHCHRREATSSAGAVPADWGKENFEQGGGWVRAGRGKEGRGGLRCILTLCPAHENSALDYLFLHTRLNWSRSK